MSQHHEDTIAALSTPAGESGIAVVRMSGGGALDVLRKMFRTAAGADEFEHRRLYHGAVVDGDDIVDDVMVACMRGPDSYSGEDVVEVSCHGNTLVVSRVLKLMQQHGARAAQPGEFTKRAFIHGKLDLIQAEAVADLIHARSELQQRVAQAQLAGGLSQRINTMAEGVLELLGTIEANIDFIEQGIDTLDRAARAEQVAKQLRDVDALLEGAQMTRPFHEGYRVTIAGPVNAGKSSLFNRIIGERRAIVTEVAGTTRDVLREPIVLDGLLFNIHDTAGLRATEDRIERIGVDMAYSALDDADIVCYIVDGSTALPDDVRDRILALDPAASLVIVNKSDLAAAFDVKILTPPGSGDTHVPVITASAETGEGMDQVIRGLLECVGREHVSRIARERIVLNARLVSLLEAASERLQALQAGLSAGAPLEILALDAREALQSFESATGERYSEDLLDNIFSRFCIGK